ncbi:hypothetical protein [Nitrosomonas sp. Is37]|nr:hypothetical protein [Nitrosomonas sp. Is37]MDV6344412.1 hypothetical protein [Nitrosomonas sp. Is37]
MLKDQSVYGLGEALILFIWKITLSQLLEFYSISLEEIARVQEKKKDIFD